MSLFRSSKAHAHAQAYRIQCLAKQRVAVSGISSVPAAFYSTAPLAKTILHDLHVEHGAKMAGFAGWSMPLFYSDQTALESHHFTRRHASLFDVSHMLQFKVLGKDRIKFFESLVVSDLAELELGRGTLSLFLNEQGGIKDDLIVTRHEDWLYVVSNAGCADKDWAHIQNHLQRFCSEGGDATVEKIVDHSLVAIQGPQSSAILQKLTDTNLDSMTFMSSQYTKLSGIPVHLARSGYTGEDGFEISIPTSSTVDFVNQLLESPNLKLAGLAPRDSLRVEAGLCLYGHDIDESTTPVEAGLVWTVGKRRRTEGAGGFIGSDVVLPQIIARSGDRRRVGLLVQGAPAREGAEIYTADGATLLGKVTSGVPSPSLSKNIAMGYVPKSQSKKGTELAVKVRTRLQPAVIVKMPFLPTNYHTV